MSLIDFSEHDVSEDLVIHSDVKFSDNKWVIRWAQSEHQTFDFGNIQLDKTRLTDYPDLCRFVKIFTYYNFPKKLNLSISSWSTTAQRFSHIKYFVRDFLWPRQFLTSRSMASVTTRQLKDYVSILLERLEQNEQASTTKYLACKHVIQSWAEFSEKKVLPKEYNLDINPNLVFTNKIASLANQLILNNTTPWQPMSPRSIELAFSEAKRYIYEYSDCIIQCQALINNRPTVGIQEELRSQVREDGRTSELFQTLTKMSVPMIDDESKLFNFLPITKKVSSKGYKRGWQYRTHCKIDEVRPEVINLKRACIFIIGLFTGMRRREIAELYATPTFVKNGEQYLSITRFKTSDDASGAGEPDNIPVPQIVSDAVNVLIRLFADIREAMGSDYLLLADKLSKKQYEKMKIDTVTKDVRAFCADVTGEHVHTHQLRKTIAWLLISQSENNVELIRQLFGHKSYGMTLRYILRNELLVSSVMEILEHNFTEDLVEAFESVANGQTAGELSQKIKSRMETRKYKGQILATDLENFIHELIKSGVPCFVSRLPIGGFCIKAGEETSIPPCMAKTNQSQPVIEFCDYKSCPHVLHNQESIDNIRKQIAYYEQKKHFLIESDNERQIEYYETQIIEHEQLLERLSETGKTHNVVKVANV